MTNKSTIRLVLGDQLNPLHSWFNLPRDDVHILMMEVRQETDYVLHHAQKIIAIFAGMRDFAQRLTKAGHHVHYLAIDDPDNLQSLPANIDRIIAHFDAGAFEYLAPDEWRLDRQMDDYVQQLSIPSQMVDSEHFYTKREEVGTLFGGRKKWMMETFYRHMRVRHRVLMEAGNKPVGGQWNYDHDNRKSWPGLPAEPPDGRIRHDHSALWRTIEAAGVKSLGQPNAAQFAWPLNRAEALQQLDDFLVSALPYFGQFQDAMSSKAWRLFHSMLSFALNTKMLGPGEVVTKVETAWRAGSVPLEAAEGFIRQILGWREYVRGMYWHHMPDYAAQNVFAHERPLPKWFWTGETKMRCLSMSITHSLKEAHAHHIQRLMVIGNFALLAGLDPGEVHRWYLGVYIDAFEWVELPNTIGMSQFADGGLMATKPYVSSAAYIDRMSDYCKGCHYDKKLRLGERACPYNALYWNFFSRNQKHLGTNPRLGMVYQQLRKMDITAYTAMQAQAEGLLGQLDDL
ncbi:cryptochrome/photolyase family protein [Glaciimonas sp. CA11.2]|uniref:cryptochrome/photolyase family protein n=1 Tax=unclassified Glaciimonas TaxID=2644401 RepID=UPI002AB4E7FC|nr:MULTISPECIES: cryptochrome/photolyase family protein [unclassified Glaciimonas]MDY7549224.1 cryptochrome/photolyase family protein [Glaciimonas sp. CA11.2]MEB0013958.1 cryptochrome/photolyase family protein [Glaciimonas sp. Cout2]MEB0083162.1 cryptochrome/photolyase family protein [Glaciimonas sp. Gout2]MEB0161653.1 cryptochrome/photolyase family protein [Glaciimonas sp. CA11.2]